MLVIYICKLRRWTAVRLPATRLIALDWLRQKKQNKNIVGSHFVCTGAVHGLLREREIPKNYSENMNMMYTHYTDNVSDANKIMSFAFWCED